MARNAEESAERERLLKEEEERMRQELDKYDQDYMSDEEVEDQNESNR